MNDWNSAKVTKANKLIEAYLVESSTRLNLRDQKIVLAVISKLSPGDDALRYRLSVMEIAALTNINSSDLYRELHSICRRLVNSLLQIVEPSNPGGFLITSWFSYAEYIPKTGYVEFGITEKLKPYLLQLNERFTTYRLQQVISLQSVYSIRAYEMLRQFHPEKTSRAISFRQLDLEELRVMLGVKKDGYPRFWDFRVNVVEVAQKELSEKTDLAFDFECLRKGRKVGAIKFAIRHNKHFEASQAPETAANQPIQLDDGLAAMLRSQLPDIADDELHMLAASHSRETLVEALLSLAGAIARQEIKTTPYQFFLGVLAKKRREKPREHQTTLEKLTDRSWADGLEVPSPTPQ